jgi:hypothetical protein
VRFPAPPDFLRSSGSGTGFTQRLSTIEVLIVRKSSGSGQENRDYVPGIRHAGHMAPSIRKIGTNFATSGDRWVGKFARGLRRRRFLSLPSGVSFQRCYFLIYMCALFASGFTLLSTQKLSDRIHMRRRF